MSIVKRILEANKFSKSLPEGWIDHAYRAHLQLRWEQLQKRLDPVHFNKPSQSKKKTDENQLSLF